jgi:hypothetical protein
MNEIQQFKNISNYVLKIINNMYFRTLETQETFNTFKVSYKLSQRYTIEY